MSWDNTVFAAHRTRQIQDYGDVERTRLKDDLAVVTHHRSGPLQAVGQR